MSNEIQEAEIISENKPDELLSRLSTATETKTPNANQAAKAWSFDLDEMKKETPQTETVSSDFKIDPPPVTQPNTQPTGTATSTEPKISKDTKLATARITVSALNSTQRIIFEPLISRKYRKKFTDDEQRILVEKNLPDQEKAAIHPDDLPLRNKFDRLMKQCNKKLNAVPFTDTEEQDLEKIFYQYMDAKNKTLPPELMLGISLANVLGKRAIDLFMD